MRDICYGAALLPDHAEDYMVLEGITMAYRNVVAKVAASGAVMVGPLHIWVVRDEEIFGGYRADVVRVKVECERPLMVRQRVST